MLHCVPSILGWIIISFSNSVTMLLIGRLFTGLAVGIFGPPAPVLIGETSIPKYRGMLLSSVSLSITFGILFSHILGSFLSWKLAAMICSIFPFVVFMLAVTIHESPAWLMSKNRVEEAEESLKWLRGQGPDFDTEFESMLKKYENSEEMTLRTVWTNVQKPQFYRPLAIVLSYFFVMQCSGVNVVTFYTVSIMADIFHGSIDEYFSTLIIDTTRVCAAVIGCILARKLKRRTLTMIGGIGTSLSIISFSGYSYMTKQMPDVLGEYTWVSLIFLVSYICFVNGALYCVPWMLKG